MVACMLYIYPGDKVRPLSFHAVSYAHRSSLNGDAEVLAFVPGWPRVDGTLE